MNVFWSICCSLHWLAGYFYSEVSYGVRKAWLAHTFNDVRRLHDAAASFQRIKAVRSPDQSSVTPDILAAMATAVGEASGAKR